VSQPPDTFDAARVAAAVREFLLGIGEDPDRPGLAETPDRVARAAAEIFAGLRADPRAPLEAQFELGHQELVLVKDIAFYSICEHHLLPFHGMAHLGYIPSAEGRITGLSKLARLVAGYARRPQVQERLTSDIADSLMACLGARGAIVVIEAEHMCMSMRGIKAAGSKTVTSAVRGALRSAATRAEAMALMG
jgi:GTP cyclohydrolase I